MALPQIVSRNQAQKIQSVEINGRVVIQPNTWYTCPTGKKAIVKGRVQCTGLGAAATADFNAAAILMFRWSNASAAVLGYLDNPRSLTTAVGGQFALFEVELAAGETITTTQNTGTNSEFNVWASVIETSA